MARSRFKDGSFRGKIRPGDKRAQQPKRPKDKGTPKKPRQGGFAGFLGAAGAVAALCIGVLVQQARRARRKDVEDALLLARMRRVPLHITEHAECRMGCRYISRAEVDEVLTAGRINSRKSEPYERPCPKYVVDGAVGPSKKNVQCVVSACPQMTKMLTVIDLDTSWSHCYCP